MRISRISLLSTFSLLSLFANPENGIVIEGNATFEKSFSELVVHADDRSIIHWDSFSIQPQEITRFIQGGANEAVLNRVTGDQMSELHGSLVANGKVFLINPNGVLVGPQGVIDAASFIASSFDISDSAFANGEDFIVEGTSLKPIINGGTIRARNGDILLLASRIENKGNLSAPSGHAMLGAGQRILVGVEGKKSLFVDVPGDGLSNEGKIEALTVLLSSNANPYTLGLQNRGIVNALQVQQKGGEIYLRCKGASLQNEGTLSAPKGKVQIEAENSLLENRGKIQSAGGTVAIKAYSGAITLAEQRPIANYGAIEAGTIDISAPKFASEGSLAADGKLTIFIPGSYIESINGKLSASEIRIAAGNYFTSGKIVAKGERGGRIEIEAERFVSTAATFDASGRTHGGSVKLSAASLNDPMYLNKYVVIDVSGKEKGGSVELRSPIPVNSSAAIKLDGKVGGKLFIPSTLSTGGFPDPFEPNPENESILWSATQSKKKTEDGILELAFCPPTSVEFVDPNPTGTNSSFGNTMVALSSGNVVVTKVNDTFQGRTNAGAVYLYNASNGALISALRGSHANDLVGSGGITVLPNGNYVIKSPNWANILQTKAGAATWASGTTGPFGSVISQANSLIGTQMNDQVSSDGVVAFPNGNYLVGSSNWQNMATGATTAGAVTWCDGSAVTGGIVSPANSLVGTTTGDQVGGTFSFAVGTCMKILTNGNYAVASIKWRNLTTGATEAGAVTWGNGAGGTVGPVSPLNSIVGTQTNDRVGIPLGLNSINPLTNGNYVVGSPDWQNVATGLTAAGAATWCNGLGGTVGAVSVTNSLVGTQFGDAVGTQITPLANGNYVVRGNLSIPPPSAVGARGSITWGNGTVGTSGTVSITNSLVGTMLHDNVGNVTPLSNGNYVVLSQNWQNVATGATAAGAATWVDGATGLPMGAVSPTNSLVGKAANDNVGVFARELSNGNYVVFSPNWANGAAAQAGAATWGNGTLAYPIGDVSATNSLVGVQAGDAVSSDQIAKLTHGDYVVGSSNWANGAQAGAGAATWCSGSGGTVGNVSPANSLVGTQANDFISQDFLIPLPSGNYLVGGSGWANGAQAGAGAVSWGNGSGGTVGDVSPTNSIVGSQAFDLVGIDGAYALSNGNYVVASSNWAYGSQSAAGAITWGNGTVGTAGVVSSGNSLVGTQANDLVGLAVFRLANGNYIADNVNWANGSLAGAGAVTWGNGATGTFGMVSVTNSLVGSQANDFVGDFGILELDSSTVAVVSSSWSSGTGAITLANSANGTFCDGTYGAVSTANSFPGSGVNDMLNNVITVNGTAGINYIVVQFLDDPGQTRIFSIPGVPIPPPGPQPTPAGIHNFAIAVTESFYEWQYDWLHMKNVLDGSDIYPPLATYKGLQLMYPSLVVAKDHGTNLTQMDE